MSLSLHCTIQSVEDDKRVCNIPSHVPNMDFLSKLITLEENSDEHRLERLSRISTSMIHIRSSPNVYYVTITTEAIVKFQ